MPAAKAPAWAIWGSIGLILVIAPVLYSASGPDRSDVYSAAVDGAEELRRTPTALTVTVLDVESALAKATRGRGGGGKFGATRSLNLKVRSAGEDSRGDRYEITSDGKHPVCMIVNVSHDPGSREIHTFPYAYVEDAPC